MKRILVLLLFLTSFSSLAQTVEQRLTDLKTNKLTASDTAGKWVAKQVGKGLSTNDFSSVYKARLDSLAYKLNLKLNISDKTPLANNLTTIDPSVGLGAPQGKLLNDTLIVHRTQLNKNTSGLATLASYNPLRTPSASQVIFRHTLQSNAAPEVGAGTWSFSRTGELSVLGSSGAWSNAANGVAAFTYNPSTDRLRYKSSEATTIFPSFGANGTTGRDLTQAGWTATNLTIAKTQTGIDATANTASLLTATAANGQALYSATAASVIRTFSAYVKRVVGSGRVWLTQDNGNTWVDVTSQLNPNSFTRVYFTQSVLNPNFGFRLETSGDAIAVDGVNLVPYSYAIDPILVRADQGVSGLQFDNMTPMLPTHRYHISMKCKLMGGININWGAIGTNSMGLIYTSLQKWNVNSFSAGVLQYNDENFSGKDYEKTIIRYGDEVKLELIAGNGHIQLYLNDRLYKNLDGTNAGFNRPDPVTMGQLNIKGNAEFSDIEIRELHSHNVVVTGDSFFSGWGYTISDRLDRFNFDFRNRAVGGNKITDVTARVASDITPAYSPFASSNTLFINVGTNTLADNVSAATALSQLTTLISTLRAGANWNRIFVNTVIPRNAVFTNGATAASFEAQRLLFNAGLSSVGADGIIDLNSIGTLSADDTVYYYTDKIHLSPYAWGLAYPLFERLLR